MAWVFDVQTYGRVVVEEEPLQVPAAEYIQGMFAVEAGNKSPNRSGVAEVLNIKGGTPALITTSGGEDGAISAIRWIEGSVVFHVRGPSLHRDDVVAIAEKL